MPARKITSPTPAPDPTPPAIPADEQVARFSLDAPPARLARMSRVQQKPLIAQANALIADGLDAHEALSLVLG